jgi:hypothetical protein
MDTFSLIRNSLASTLDDATKAGLAPADIEVGRIVTAVQVVVDVLTPPDGGRYIVGFSDITTAATQLGARKITVSSKPLTDRSLSTVEKAVVIATFAAHEIGHTLVTRPRRDRIAAHNPKSGYHAVANLADDIILEPYMVERFPILQDAFAFTGLWVLRTTAKSVPMVAALPPRPETHERFNVLLDATRYGDDAPIIWDVSALADKAWGRAWADRLLAARLTDHVTFLALCDEAWERIRTIEPDEDEPDESGDEPGEDEGDEPGDEPDGDDGEGEDDESDDEPTDDGDGQGEDEDADDDEQDGDDDSDGGDDATDEDGPDGESDEDADDDERDPDEDGGDEPGGDEPTGKGKGKGGDESDEDEDADDDERDPEGGVKTGKRGDDIDQNDEPIDWDDDKPGDGEDEGHGETPTKPGQNGGGNAEATVRDEDDFNTDEVEQSTHDQSEPDERDWNAREWDEKVRTYASTTVTAFGRHGSLSTDWQ